MTWKEREEALEEMIDNQGIQCILRDLSTICNRKSEHVLENWQDEALANEWFKAGDKIDQVAAKKEIAVLCEAYRNRK